MGGIGGVLEGILNHSVCARVKRGDGRNFICSSECLRCQEEGLQVTVRQLRGPVTRRPGAVYLGR